MKLAQKLTLAFILATCAILAVNAYLRVHREVDLFESRSARDHRLLCRTVRSAILAVWRTEGEARALALVDDLDQQQPKKVTFRWVWLEGDGALQMHVSPHALDGAKDNDTVMAIDRDPNGEPTRYTYVPVTAVDGRHAALEVSEPLSEANAYVRKTVTDTLVTTAMLVAVTGFVAMALGLWLVGRPVRALVDKARRIGSGDFSRPLAIDRRDEIGVLAGEMNAMCDRLVEAREDLESATKARIAALEQLRHADRLSTVGKLASGIAHELGTPLNVISGRASMIATKEVEGTEAIESAKIVVQASDRVTAIIRQLLDFARRRGPQRAEEDLGAIARQTTSLLRTLAGKKRVTLEVTGDAHVVADVDSSQLQQALTNLVVNAIQAVNTGGNVIVTLGAERAKPPPDLEGDAEVDTAFLRVKDDGPGMTDEVLAHVFDPFFTTKGVGEGTGLGLSVAWGIARDHGGWIAADSAPGKGATFTLHLPRTPKPMKVDA
jgi:signal transduction histidine kinase